MIGVSAALFVERALLVLFFGGRGGGRVAGSEWHALDGNVLCQGLTSVLRGAYRLLVFWSVMGLLFFVFTFFWSLARTFCFFVIFVSVVDFLS